MPWKSKLLAEIKKIYGVITHVMFVVTCNCNWNQLSDESTEEESAKKTLTRTIFKTRTKLRDFFFFFCSTPYFSKYTVIICCENRFELQSKHAILYTLYLFFSVIFLHYFGRLRQHKTFCSKNVSLVSHFAYFSDLLMPHG